MKRWGIIVIVTGMALVLSAWIGVGMKNHKSETSMETNNEEMENDTTTTATEPEDEESEGEEVSLKNSEGDVVAEATLTKADSGVHVNMDFDGLPEGTHAFHVHEKGVCEEPDFESAGDHYNPTDMKHGKLHPEGPHAGDFDNIEVDENGKAHVEFTTDQVSLEKEKENTLYTDEGTSLVIHADPDDYKSQPAGDAGDRIACGVISE